MNIQENMVNKKPFTGQQNAMPKRKVRAPALVTKDSLKKMLEHSNPKYVELVVARALVGIFERQTASEQHNNAVTENNGIGFAGCDAHSGSLTAKYWLKHKRLEPWQIQAWLRTGESGYPRLCRYVRQLNEIAKEKIHD